MCTYQGMNFSDYNSLWPHYMLSCNPHLYCQRCLCKENYQLDSHFCSDRFGDKIYNRWKRKTRNSPNIQIDISTDISDISDLYLWYDFWLQHDFKHGFKHFRLRFNLNHLGFILKPFFEKGQAIVHFWVCLVIIDIFWDIPLRGLDYRVRASPNAIFKIKISISEKSSFFEYFMASDESSFS